MNFKIILKRRNYYLAPIAYTFIKKTPSDF